MCSYMEISWNSAAAPTNLTTNDAPARRRAGFTLIELLVVIAIIAILATAMYIDDSGGRYPMLSFGHRTKPEWSPLPLGQRARISNKPYCCAKF